MAEQLPLTFPLDNDSSVKTSEPKGLPFDAPEIARTAIQNAPVVDYWGVGFADSQRPPTTVNQASV